MLSRRQELSKGCAGAVQGLCRGYAGAVRGLCMDCAGRSFSRPWACASAQHSSRKSPRPVGAQQR